MTDDLMFLGDLARRAGAAILEVYAGDFAVEEKSDHSPLTLADTQSHAIIEQGLQDRYPQIPLLSEEGKDVPFAVRRSWPRFWLVDPLDGTKEFVKRNGEFTVNIALVEGDLPLLGVIYIPVADLLYVADTGRGCWEICRRPPAPANYRRTHSITAIRVATSRSHPSPDLQAYTAGCYPLTKPSSGAVPPSFARWPPGMRISIHASGPPRSGIRLPDRPLSPRPAASWWILWASRFATINPIW